MQSRKWSAPLALAFTVFVSPAVRAEVRELSLGDVIAIARDESPAARQAAAEVALAEAAVAEVAPLLPENPSVEGTAGQRNDGERGEEWSAGGSLTLYVPGQRGYRLSAARRRLSAARAELEQVRLGLVADAAGAFLDALASRERAELAAESERLAAELLSAATRRLETGAASGLDLDLARIEHARARLERLDAERDATHALAALARRIGLAPGTELRLAGDLADATDRLPSVEEVRGRAGRRERGDVRAAELRVEAALRERTAERLDVVPRPTVFGEVAREEGDDLTRIGVSIPLPLLRTNAGGRRAANARLDQARAALDGARAEADADLDAALARYEAARGAVEAFDRAVLDALEQNEEALGAAFRGGKIDFASWIVLRRDALALRSTYFEALAELRQSLYDLDRALGGGLAAGTPVPE